MLIIDDDYRTSDYRPMSYDYISGEPIELNIPVGDRILPFQNYTITIKLIHALTKTEVLSEFVIGENCEIPISITSNLIGNYICTIGVDSSMFTKKNIKVRLNES